MVWNLWGKIRPIPFSICAPRRMKEIRGCLGDDKSDCTGCYHQKCGATNIFSFGSMELNFRFVFFASSKYLTTILYVVLNRRSHSFAPKAHSRYLLYYGFNKFPFSFLRFIPPSFTPKEYQTFLSPILHTTRISNFPQFILMSPPAFHSSSTFGKYWPTAPIHRTKYVIL